MQYKILGIFIQNKSALGLLSMSMAPVSFTVPSLSCIFNSPSPCYLFSSLLLFIFSVFPSLFSVTVSLLGKKKDPTTISNSGLRIYQVGYYRNSGHGSLVKRNHGLLLGTQASILIVTLPNRHILKIINK